MEPYLVFADPVFPSDVAGLQPAAVQRALTAAGWPCVVVSAAELKEALACRPWRALLWLQGSYFPEDAWSALYRQLQAGVGLIFCGGRPFWYPVWRTVEGWQPQPRQVSYHRALGIYEVYETPLAEPGVIEVLEGGQTLAAVASRFQTRHGIACVWHLAQGHRYPHELGAEGWVSAEVEPLLHQRDAAGYVVTSPVLQVTHRPPAFAGSRWIWAWGDPLRGAAFPEQMAVIQGLLEAWQVRLRWQVRSAYACYEPGEAVTIQVAAERPADAVEGGELEGCGTLEIWSTTPDRRRLWTQSAPLAERSPWRETVRIPEPFDPGLYDVAWTWTPARGAPQRVWDAFWVKDAALLAMGERLRVGRQYFRRGDRHTLVVGTTYMDPRAGRAFLQDPHPFLWDRDFALLRAWGVSLIRTGLWTGWEALRAPNGEIPEAALRALDALVLTAQRHGLDVVFTFFAFTPPTWAGPNPYLSPGNQAAQARFVTAIAERYRTATHVHWDLINEPSTFDPRRPFAGPVPLKDPDERAAFRAWLTARDSLTAIRQHWDETPIALPTTAELEPPDPATINFDLTDVMAAKRGQRWLDYVQFSDEMLGQWAATLARVAREASGDALVTVGQDEAWGQQRPTQFFRRPELDYSTVHTWWLGDHLLWDGVMARFEGKPLLVQETGIMHVERPNGHSLRTEEDARDLLARKFAYAFMAGATGVVQWIWQTNSFMDNPNESTIGAVRHDGSLKPEAFVLRDFAQFVRAVRPYVTEPRPECVGIFVPEEHMAAHRSVAIVATQRAVDALFEVSHHGVRAIRAADLAAGSTTGLEVLWCPVPHNLSETTFQTLAAWVRAGGVVIWTGPLSWDRYFAHSRRHEFLTGPLHRRPLMLGEVLRLEDREVPLHFSYVHACQSELELPADASLHEAVPVYTYSLGSGCWIWCPLPVELAESRDAVQAVYHALGASVLRDPLRLHGGRSGRIISRKIAWQQAIWYLMVSEAGVDERVTVEDRDTRTHFTVHIPRGGVAMWVVDNAGKIVARYGEVSLGIS
ncbi:MAG: cellulase family glycosylhydrolase [Firmicutes bacterium]|nr:cellulase family glycosylhydrolase [Bacillota bacterium]